MKKKVSKKVLFPIWNSRKYCYLSVVVFCTIALYSCKPYKSVILKIGLVADPQYADQPTKDKRFYRESLWKLRQAIDTFNLQQVDFVQTLGDVIDVNHESFDSILPLYEKLDPKIESYQLLGNHEFHIDPNKIKESFQKLEMPSNYYSYVRGNWRFIILDSNEHSFYSQGYYDVPESKTIHYFEHTESEANRKDWNGAIGLKQQNWLNNELVDSQAKNQKVIVFAHMPLLPRNSVLNLWNNYEIIPILEKFPNVIAFINGHNHESAYHIENGIHYITLFGMVDTPIGSFAILEIYDDRLELKGYGNQRDISFELK